MEKNIKIHLTNNHKLFLSLFFILVIITVSGVIAYETIANQNNPGVQSHSPGEININISGSVKTLQQAINDDDLQNKFEGCMIHRSQTLQGVSSISWCPSSHPKAIHCSPSGSASPSSGPTQMTRCLTEGGCSYSAGVGNDGFYFELVENPNTNVQGCWAYEVDGWRLDNFRIDKVCCT